MAILPRVRVFYELATARVLATKAFRLAELLPGALIPTDTEILSRERYDPAEVSLVEVFSNIVSEKSPRVLRVVSQSVLTEISDSSITPPVTPFISPLANHTAKYKEKGVEKDVVILDAALVKQESAPAEVNPFHPVTPQAPTARDLLVIEVKDPTAIEDNPPKPLSVLVVERTTIVLGQDVNLERLGVDATDALVVVVPSVEVTVSKPTNEGYVVGAFPINNSVSARKVTENIAGIVKVVEASNNTNSSDQEGRNGMIRWTRVVSHGTSVFFLAWKPPEAVEFGLPVEVKSPDLGTCTFVLLNVRDVVNPANGETSVKEVSLTVEVDASFFPTDLVTLDEEIVIKSAFRKTFDGRTILGDDRYVLPALEEGTLTNPNVDLFNVPTFDLLDPFGIGTKGSLFDPVTRKTTLILNVDQQGRYLWYDPEKPIPDGRKERTAIFERRFPEAVPLTDIPRIQNEVLEEDFPVWLLLVPNRELLLYLQELRVLRPFTRDPEAPDSKTYPYQAVTPIDLRTNPEVLLPDELLAHLSNEIIINGGGSIGHPVSNVVEFMRSQRLPFFIDTHHLYYFFVIESESLNGFTISQNKFMAGTAPGDPTVADRPLSTFLTNTESGTTIVATIPIIISFGPFGEVFGEYTVTQTQVPSPGESVLIFVYPREFHRDKSKTEQRLNELAQSCDEERSPMETADMLQEVLNLLK